MWPGNLGTMLGWKAKPRPEESPDEEEPELLEEERDDEEPTWASADTGRQNPVSRIYGRPAGDELYEARLALAE